MTDRPNVVLITCHDLGTQLGCYGWDVETPNLDAMADAGVRFDEAFCTAPQCSPSRCSIATGLHPHQHGMMGLSHRGWSLSDEDDALPWRVSEAGYETRLFGFQHETDWSHPERLGYDAVHRADDGEGHPPAQARDVADRFDAALDDLTDAEQPFFATLGFVEPHRPFRRESAPEAAYDRYDPTAVEPLPYLEFEDQDRRAEHCRDLADFRALISATVDPAVGTVRKALRERGMAEDTVVVFTTDHGEPFDRAKTTCYDPGLRTALLVDAPGRFEAGVCRDLVSNVDLYSTILDLVGGPVDGDVRGRSLLPLLDGGESERAGDEPDEVAGADGHRDRVYAEQTWHVLCKPMRAVRTERFKYVRNFRPYAGGSGDVPSHEFYDLDADPHEGENLVDPDSGVPEAHVETFAALQSDLYEWMRETGDPLARGCIPLPDADRIEA